MGAKTTCKISPSWSSAPVVTECDVEMWSEANAGEGGQLPPSRGVLTKENLRALSKLNSFRASERDIEDTASTRSTLRSRSRKKRNFRINAKGSVTSKSSTETSSISLLSDNKPGNDTWSSFNSDKAREPSVLQLDGSVVAYNFKPKFHQPRMSWMAEEVAEDLQPSSPMPPPLPPGSVATANPLTLKFAGIENGKLLRAVKTDGDFSRKALKASIQKALDYNQDLQTIEEEGDTEIMYLPRKSRNNLQIEMANKLAEGPCIAAGVGISVVLCFIIYYIHLL